MPAHNFIDLTGQTFGYWTVLHRDFTRQRPVYFVCQCICGKKKSVNAYSLRAGKSTHCRCLQNEAIRRRSTKHGMAPRGKQASEYTIWKSMMARCYNIKNAAYPRYGGRGIVVTQRWHNFGLFFADIGVRPAPQYSIERINNDGPYSPENCRWATRKEQNRNTRTNIFLTWNNKTLCIAEWAERLHVRPNTLYERHKLGWTTERILTTPTRKTKPLHQLQLLL